MKLFREYVSKLISFQEWRKDKEKFKGQKENPQGYIAGNPRFGKNLNKLAGNTTKTRSKIKKQDRKDMGKEDYMESMEDFFNSPHMDQ